MFVTFLTFALMISFTVNRCVKLVDASDPFFSMLTMASEDEQIDLWELNYMFAVEKLDPRVGRVKATQVIWGTEIEKIKQNIELVDCVELMPGGKHEGKSNNKDFS